MTDAPVVRASQPGVFARMAERFQMDTRAFEATVRATLMPKGKENVGNEHIAAFLLVADRYKLDPFRKEIYAFASRKGGIEAMVPIDGWAAIINNRPELDGIEFEWSGEVGDKSLECTCIIHRKDRSRPTRITEYLSECYQKGKDPWERWPRRMLRHKALIQCARIAFALGGIYEPDEADRIIDMEPLGVRTGPGPNDGPPPGTAGLVETVKKKRKPRAKSKPKVETSIEAEAVASVALDGDTKYAVCVTEGCNGAAVDGATHCAAHQADIDYIQGDPHTRGKGASLFDGDPPDDLPDADTKAGRLVMAGRARWTDDVPGAWCGKMLSEIDPEMLAEIAVNATPLLKLTATRYLKALEEAGAKATPTT